MKSRRWLSCFARRVEKRSRKKYKVIFIELVDVFWVFYIVLNLIASHSYGLSSPAHVPGAVTRDGSPKNVCVGGLNVQSQTEKYFQ